MKKPFLIFFLALIFSCNDDMSDTKTVQILKESPNQSKITDKYLDACSKINQGDTVFVEFLLKDLKNVATTHNYKFKGITVYQAKMNALRRISGLEPPRKITYKYDQDIVDFYTDWAINNGFTDTSKITY